MNTRAAGRFALIAFATALLAGGVLLSLASPSHVDDLGWLALALTIVVTAALAGGHVAGRLGQAAVLGELLAGVVLGSLPAAARLRFIADDPYLDILARIGMLLLMFE